MCYVLIQELISLPSRHTNEGISYAHSLIEGIQAREIRVSGAMDGVSMKVARAS